MTTLLRRADRCNPVFTGIPAGFDQAFADLMRPYQSAPTSSAIRFDVSEDAAAYHVSATLAGVTKDEINVAVDGVEVTIGAEFKEPLAREGVRVLHSERAYGKASRTFRVATEIDEAKVEAKFTDGVLSLTLPKKIALKATKINIS